MIAKLSVTEKKNPTELVHEDMRMIKRAIRKHLKHGSVEVSTAKVESLDTNFHIILQAFAVETLHEIIKELTEIGWKPNKIIVRARAIAVTNATAIVDIWV